ncbi:phage tail tape measure C-terminal domain-containing protein [Pseudomonas aeruginosa]
MSTTAAQDEAQSNWLDGVTSAWENYRDTATDYQQQAADFTTQTLDGLTSAVGDGIASMIMDGESLADVFKNIAQTMGHQASSTRLRRWPPNGWSIRRCNW